MQSTLSSAPIAPKRGWVGLTKEWIGLARVRQRSAEYSYVTTGKRRAADYERREGLVTARGEGLPTTRGEGLLTTRDEGLL